MIFTRKEWSYVFYDWAESCFTVIVAAFIFPLLWGQLTAGVANGEAIYGFVVAAVSLLVAILSPILGTIADYRGYKKRFFTFFFVLGIIFTFGIGFFPVEPELWWAILIPYILASVGYAGSNVFYDAFLIDVTSNERMDRVSTAGYAFGYIGGSTIPLILAIFLLQVLPAALAGEIIDIFGVRFEYTLDTGFRLTFFLTAIWWLLFSIPFLRNVRQIHGIAPEKQIVLNSFRRLAQTFKDIRSYKHIFVFLAAYFLYIDGVHTIISLAVPFAANAIEEITPDNATAALLPVFLVIQVAAFAFSILFAILSRRYSTRSLLFVAIGIYTLISIFALFVTEVIHFWVLGLLVATSQGAIQSLSRSYFGKIVPKDKGSEFFGFYTIFGRFASILGPLLVAGISLGVTSIFGPIPGGTMRYGVLSLILLFGAGALIFSRLPRTFGQADSKD